MNGPELTKLPGSVALGLVIHFSWRGTKTYRVNSLRKYVAGCPSWTTNVLSSGALDPKVVQGGFYVRVAWDGFGRGHVQQIGTPDDSPHHVGV